MSRNQKIIIFLLLIASLIIWIGVLIIPNFFKGTKTRSTAPDNRQLFSWEEIKEKYVSARSLGKNYTMQTLQDSYRPEELSQEFGGYNVNSLNGKALFDTKPWTVGNKTIYATFFTSVISEKYRQDNLPLQYRIFVKEPVKDNASLADEFKRINEFFIAPANIDLKNAKESVIPEVGKAMEITWKNPDNSIDSRAVIEPSGAKGKFRYFVAIKTFPESSAYNTDPLLEFVPNDML